MKNLDNLKITKYETSIADLPDRIENRADWLKKQFDGRTDNEVKKQHNALVDEVARFEDDTYPKGNVYTKEEIDAQEAALSAGITAADSKAQAAQDDLNGFKERQDNPHKVTAAQTGAYTKEEVNGQNAVLSSRITTADSKAQAAQDDLNGFKAKRDNPHMVTAAQTGAYTKEETDSAIDKKITELGAGDMAKAVYDKNNNGIVDNAEKLGGKEENQLSVADSTKFGGQLPEAYMQVDDYGGSDPNTVRKADDANALGGKEPAYYYPIRRNLLDNWYFGNPVNQRGENAYPSERGSDYGIDRWRSDKNLVVQNLTDNVDSMTLVVDKVPPLGSSVLLQQKFERNITGTVTVSFLIKKSRADLQVRDQSSNQSENTTEWQLFSNTIQNANLSLVELVTDSGLKQWDKIIVKAAKLELGDTQTLAHQENGEWVLNEIPNFAEELAKCQRYYWEVDKGAGTSAVLMKAAATNVLIGNVPFPVTMRKNGGNPKTTLTQLRNVLTGAIHSVKLVQSLTTSDGLCYIGVEAGPAMEVGGNYELQDLIVDANL